MNDLIRKIREFGDIMYTAGESETDEKHLIAGEALFDEIANTGALMNEKEMDRWLKNMLYRSFALGYELGATSCDLNDMDRRWNLVKYLFEKDIDCLKRTGDET